MPPARAYAAFDAESPLRPFDFERRACGPRDVQIEILFCGVCHSDLHIARSEWFETNYPCVPGHEIVGRVQRIGIHVTRFNVDDLVGVGCMVDSCKSCSSCREGLEQYCVNDGITWTYNSPDRRTPGAITYGGYSNQVVVDERFCLNVSKTVDLASTAPLLCAGITTYSPLRHWEAGPGKRVGIVGLGGLGHMGVKFSSAFGAHTVVFTTSPDKIEPAMRLGANEVVLASDDDAVAAHNGSFDIILDTVSARHDLDRYTSLLRRDGTLVLVGVPEHEHPSPSVVTLMNRRRRIAASLIGGIRETQEMLDFCASRRITCDVEIIPIQKINDAYERMLHGDVRFRFVIDLASLGG
jgi:uncharacterized zinc-type alcohol dehydrogenase-like protein